jgi:hypothetical protein
VVATDAARHCTGSIVTGMNRVAHQAASAHNLFAIRDPRSGTDSETQSPGRLAHQYARDLAVLAGRITGLLRSFDARFEMPEQQRGFEICAAVWAAALLAIEASSLPAERAEELALATFDAVMPHWQRSVFADARPETEFQAHVSRYLVQDAFNDQIRISSRLAEQLLEATGAAAESKTAILKPLASLFAVRMLDDVFRLNSASAHAAGRGSTC